MARKVYPITSPEELIELYDIQPEGNESMMNLARVWRAERSKGHVLSKVAEIRISSKKKTIGKIFKTIGKERLIGEVCIKNTAYYES